MEKRPDSDNSGYRNDKGAYNFNDARSVNQEKLNEYRRRVHDIIQFLPDATFVIDKDKKVAAWNKAIEEMSGIKAEEVVGRADYVYALPFYGERRPVLVDMVLEGNIEEIESYYDAIWKRGNTYYCETYAGALYDNRGAYIWATASPIFNNEGEVVGAIESVRDITDFKRSQEALKESEEKYREILSTIEEGYYEVDLYGTFVFCNDSLCRIGGYSYEEILNMNYKDIYADPQEVFNTYNKVFRSGQPEKAVGWPIKTKDGREKFIEVSISLKRDKKGQPVGFRGVARDITERKLAEEKIRHLQEELELILDTVPNLIWSIEGQSKVGFANKACADYLAVSPESIGGMTINELLGREEADMLKQCVSEVEESGEEKRIEKQFTDAHGNYKWLDIVLTPVFDAKGTINWVLCTATDLTERKMVEQQLKYLSMHDHLTGLYNRMYFEEELKRINNPRHYPVTIMECDVDGLKLINDTLGHKKGDELLRAAAKLIKTPLRASDVVARIGGDEFGVVIPNTGEDAAAGIVQRINEDVERHNMENEDLTVGISIGWVTSEKPVASLADLFKQADDNMYKEKLRRSSSTREDIIEGFMKVLAQRDYLASGHVTRLQEMGSMMGQEIGISVGEMGALLLLAQVHDIGMVAVPDYIVFKEGKLNDMEWEEIKRHPEVGCRIARSSTRIAHVADLILQHHEWWNGQGYPRGLQGSDIHICARILAVADAYDVITSERSYKRAFSHDEAIDELQRCKGSQFDPDLVDILTALMNDKRKGRK